MARKSSVPEEILRCVPCKCCRVRLDPGGVYRVYKYSAVKLPSGKWSSNYGYLIGKITPEDGFIPNKRYLGELEAQEKPAFPEGITDTAYGQYGLLLRLSGDVLEKLEQYFPRERAAQIYAYALLLCANSFADMEQTEEFYRESFLSVLYRDHTFDMGAAGLSALLRDLGMEGGPARLFEQSLIDGCSGNVAVACQAVWPRSDGASPAGPGWEGWRETVSLLTAWDTRAGAPLLVRAFYDLPPDGHSVAELLESRPFADTEFLADGAFYSDEALGLMSRNGSRYVIPLPPGSWDHDRVSRALESPSGEFVYTSEAGDSALVSYYEEQAAPGTRIIVYRDEDENGALRRRYLRMADLGEEGYTREDYDKLRDRWGVYILQTNAGGSAAEVYADYRDGLSSVSDRAAFRNDVAFRELKTRDYYIQRGFDLILLVTGLVYARLREAVGSLENADLSVSDVLLKAGHMRMALEGEEWKIRNTRRADLDLLGEMGFVPQMAYPETEQGKT